MMRIAMIYEALTERTGGARQILRLALQLQKMGHEVEIFANAVDEEKCYPDILKNVIVNVVSHPVASFRPSYSSSSSDVEKTSTSYVRKFSRKIIGRQFYTSDFPSMLNLGRKIPRGFDIINNHSPPTEWAAFFAKKRLKIPVVWMCNEPPFWFFLSDEKKGLRIINWPIFEAFDRVAVKYIDEIVNLSRIAQDLVWKVYHRSSKIVRSGIDAEFFHKASGKDIRRKYGLENDFVLLQVGAFDPPKRQIDSIKALSLLSKNYDNIKLILDGAHQPEALKKFSEKLGVKDKAIFLYTKSDEELAKVYAACDVLVFPSQVTWGLAAIEAMAATKAVIVSDKAGVSEIIQNGVNGIVINHAQPEQIAEKVELLMNNPKLRETLGENAYDYVNRNLSWGQYAKNMENVFQRVYQISREKKQKT
jgi:glycosyltransferase involved in cell wall biosynthesis